MSTVEQLKWGQVCYQDTITSEDQAGLAGEWVKWAGRKGVWGSLRASSGCQSTWMALGKHKATGPGESWPVECL